MSNERMITSEWFKDRDGDKIMISSSIGRVAITVRSGGIMSRATANVVFKVDELKEILKEIDRHQEILNGGVVEK